jgi:glycosyltransferase involved in cell wall biosynthesis
VVSTIITVFNRPELVAEAVQSVLAQTYRPIEIIVVDDGSTDRSGEVVERLARDHAGTITCLRQDNAGFTRAVNAGLARITGEFVQFLDSDDVLMPDKFARQVEGLRAHPECAISYCYAREYAMGAAPPDAPARRTGERFEELFPALLGGRLWPSPVPLYRRDLLDRLGVYREVAIHPEWEYEARAAAQRVTLHHVPLFLTDVRGVHHLEGRTKGDVPPQLLPDYVAVLEAVDAHARMIPQPAAAFAPLARRALTIARRCDDAGARDEARRCRAIAARIDASRTIPERVTHLARRAKHAAASRMRDLVPLWRGKQILRRYTAHYEKARRAYDGRSKQRDADPAAVGVRALPLRDPALIDRVARSAAALLDRSSDRRFFPSALDPITIELIDPFSIDGLRELCDPLLVELERSVYGSYTIADKVYVYRTMVSGAGPQKSWLWHFDNHPREMLKVMIYLSDVGDGNAPFEFIRRRSTGAPLYGSPIAPTFGTNRLSEAEIARRLESGWERCRMTGPRGTTILFDDNVVHRGTIARTGHRDVVVFQVRPVPFPVANHIDARWTGTFGHRQFHLDPDDLQPQPSA